MAAESLPSAVAALHLAAGDLCDEFDDLPRGAEIRSFPLGAGATIWIVPCTGGAYNIAYRLYQAEGDDIALLMFADYTEYAGWAATDRLVNVELDPASGRLTSWYLGRGVGDCGSRATWQFDGSRFVLLEFRYKPDCDGQDVPWPSVFERQAPALTWTPATQ